MDIKVLASSSQGNGYVISDGVSSLLIECGIPMKQIKRKLNFDLSGIAGCLISHGHQDHCKAWKDIAKAGIDLYMSRGTADHISATGHRINIIKAKEQMHIDTFIVLPFDTQHDIPEPLGFLIYSTITKEKLLFITDSYYCKYKFPGCKYIMVECNYSPDILHRNIDEGRVSEAMKNRLLTSHFSLPNVKKFLQANDLSKVEEIYLLHLSAGNSDAARFKREIQELTGKVVIV